MSGPPAATGRGFVSMLYATALLGLCSACGSKTIPLATIPDSDAGDAAVGDAAVGDAAVGDAGLHELCNGPIDCRPGTICVKSATACDAQGTCEPAVSCLNAPYSPVCGCNLATYVNDCQRINAGVGQTLVGVPGCFTIDAGADQCDVRTNAGCNGTKCAALWLSCGLPPTCWATPESCPDRPRWDPCSGSGETCISTCDAIRQGGAYKIATCEFQR